jgi:hypothetical protein
LTAIPEHSSELEALRAELMDLRRQREWTQRQHRRWAQERQALLLKIRRLRMRLPATDFEVLAPDASPATVDEFPKNTWLSEQYLVWRQERDLLAEALARFSFSEVVSIIGRRLFHPLVIFRPARRR